MKNLKAAIDAFDLLKDRAALVTVAGRVQKQVTALLEANDLVLRKGEIVVRRFVNGEEHIAGRTLRPAAGTAAARFS